MTTFHAGQTVWFTPSHPQRVPARQGEFVKEVRKGVFEVILSGDPFPVCVSSLQVQGNQPSPSETNPQENKMPTTATAEPKASAKELRRLARELLIEGWEDFTLSELRAAVNAKLAAKPARKSTAAKKATPARKPVVNDIEVEDEDEAPAPAKRTAKKAPAAAKPAAKKAADEAEVEAENGNPFKPGTNMFYFTEELIKGGKRSAMVKRLRRKVELKPRDASEDYDVDAELDRRLLITGQILARSHGWEVTREGRGGADATIIAVAP